MIADWINAAIENHGNDERLSSIHDEVKELCAGFPVPGISTTEAALMQELSAG
jgi:glycine/serine hydroxymethyltransferase